MKITHHVLLFSILLLGACSAEEEMAEESGPPPPDLMDPFDRELLTIMASLRSTASMNRYSIVSPPVTLADSTYTEETKEYLFFDNRKTIFNSACLTKADGKKEGSSKNFDNEFIKKHRAEGYLKKIKNPKILIKNTTTGDYTIVAIPSNYGLYGWNFTHINRWYHPQTWEDELDLIVGRKLPFFIKEVGGTLTIKRTKYIIHSPDVSEQPEVIYLINEPFGDPSEISYEKEYL